MPYCRACYEPNVDCKCGKCLNCCVCSGVAFGDREGEYSVVLKYVENSCGECTDCQNYSDSSRIITETLTIPIDDVKELSQIISLDDIDEKGKIDCDHKIVERFTAYLDGTNYTCHYCDAIGVMKVRLIKN